MKSLFAPARGAGGVDRVDHAVQMLEEEWRRRSVVPLERWWGERRRLLESESIPTVVLLAELVRTDLRCRYARGESPAIADYLDRFPELEAADSRVLSLIYEEFCLAEERGERVDVDAFCDRYPRWKDSLVSQLQYHHLLSQAAGVRPKAPPPFPEVGENFEEFQLVSLLGRGGISRVFLARDLSLGGKRVVLKVSLDRGREPQAQGPLEHPHIVPVNSVVFGVDGMRGLSMPYRPGLPLDELIRRVDPSAQPKTGLCIWKAVVKASEATERADSGSMEAAPTVAGPRGDAWEGFPIGGTYARGCAWIVKVIAEALDYAHRHQTYHRDVKPGNILITIHHGPQLFDFNLADSPHSANQAQAAMNGGTLPYMAPEQIEAFLNPDLWGKVGAQADVYSLGLVLRELLTGQAPDLPAETLSPARAMRVLLDRRPLLDVSVRRSTPGIPHALEAIVAKCLAIPLEDRYPTAGALAEDLDRFLRRRPLAHAANPCRRERWANWGVRNRTRLAVGTACLASLLALSDTARPTQRLRPPVPIESSPELASVVMCLDAGRAPECTDLLDRMADRYRDSALPALYLAFAYDATEHPIKAERSFDEALDRPKAREDLLDWSRHDPGLRDRLERFAERELGEAADQEREGGRGASGTANLKDRYRRVVWALERSLEIRERRRAGREESPDGATVKDIVRGLAVPEELPDLHSIEYALALAAQEAGEYQKVIGLSDRGIKILDAWSAKDWKLEQGLARSIYSWRRLRSRSHTKLAERMRETDEGDGQPLAAALGHLDAADADLQDCLHNIETYSLSTPDLRGLTRIQLAAALVRLQILIDRRDRDAAQSCAGRARDLMKDYETLVLRLGQPNDRDYWWDRLRDIERRLDQELAVHPGSEPPPRTETPKERPAQQNGAVAEHPISAAPEASTDS